MTKVDDRLAEVHHVIARVARCLGDMRDEVVFLGGATTALLVTDAAAAKPRLTKDVDIIIEIAGFAEYARLGERLRDLGFGQDASEGAPMCRYIVEGTKVDVMPSVDGPWGPSNRWYGAALRTATVYPLPDGTRIRLVAAPLFLATKLEAWKDRGKGDYLASHDLEDIVAVVDGRPFLFDECRTVDDDVREYLRGEIDSLLDTPDFVHALPGHLSGDAVGQSRVPLVLERFRQIAGRAPGAGGGATGDTQAADVREHLIRAMNADFVGPFIPDAKGADERLPLPPSRWYLCGFLAPQEGREAEELRDPSQEDELAGGDDDGDESEQREPEAKARNFWPASMGLSIFLPRGTTADRVSVQVRYADYVREDSERRDAAESGEKDAAAPWRRLPRTPPRFDLELDPKILTKGIPVPGSGGLFVEGEIQDVPSLANGARALALFLVNRREKGQPGRLDEQFIFQAELSVEFSGGLEPKPNTRHEGAADWDDRVADLQFRDRVDYAVGHGVSVETIRRGGKVVGARTTWLPRATVRRVVTPPALPDVMVEMEDLARLEDGAAAKAALLPLATHYSAWIEQQAGLNVGSDPRRETAAQLLLRASRARRRIEEGIALLASDPEVLRAFKLANAAMAEAARQRSPERYRAGGQGQSPSSSPAQPSWRLFQLAFVLLSLPSAADDLHDDRETVELIFFPTGGGKTEAYLGLIAFILLLRRLRGQARPDGGLGVAVILRYTLRLLTLDQLGRAATLMCALELLRQADPKRFGSVRFSLGLWVGKSATANTMKDVKEKVTEFRNSSSASAPSPFPLPSCPWCGSAFTKDSLELVPRKAPTEVVVGCANFRCAFAPAKNREGLPVLFVDEQLYRELPCFIVATVDKFAMLPWRGETGALFGRVHSRSGKVFYGPTDGEVPDPKAEPLADGLRPPELIVQDELHLISGPLGTMVGLYEAAVEGLCIRRASDGKIIKPKIIASTATVRRATNQIMALYGRADLAMFPPAGINDSESFFATLDREGAGREYVGVAAPGRSAKAIMLRTYVTLLGAAQRRWIPKGQPGQAADPYMTLVGYFNSLRELGGMRRLVEDEVRSRCLKLEDRRPEGFGGAHPWMTSREVRPEPVELTSRESTYRIAQAKDQLGKAHIDPEHVDVALASNMISVGVDIERLGLMVVGGQPKTTSEYIQASSRVGRDAQRPGLVVTVYNLHKPRDRSYYERFGAYHDCFYRFVEATSVTPFSGPALERGFAGTLVALTRLSDAVLTPANAPNRLEARRQVGLRAAEWIADRARRQPGHEGASPDRDALAQALVKRGQSLLDNWQTIARATTEAASERVYSRFDKDCRNRKALLYTILDDETPAQGTDEALFAAPTSMRDVEPSVHLWISRQALTTKAPGSDDGT